MYTVRSPGGSRMNIRSLRCAILLSVGPCLVAASLPKSSPEEVGLSADRLKRVHALVQRYIDKGEIAGAVSPVGRVTGLGGGGGALGAGDMRSPHAGALTGGPGPGGGWSAATVVLGRLVEVVSGHGCAGFFGGSVLGTVSLCIFSGADFG